MRGSWPKVFTVEGFLLYGGFLLLAVGALGYSFLIGPTMEKSIFGEVWWFDNRENFAHFTIGIAALLCYSLLTSRNAKKMSIIVIGTLAAIVSVYNIQQTKILDAALQAPLDTLFHAAIACWAYLAAFHPQNRHHTHTSA